VGEGLIAASPLPGFFLAGLEKMAKKKKPKRLFRKRERIKFFRFSPRNKMIEEPKETKGGHDVSDQT